MEFTIELSDLIQDTKVVNGTTYVAIPQYSVDIGINADAGTLPGFLLKQWYMVWDYDNHQMYFAKYKSSDELSENIIEVPDGYELPLPTQDAPDPTNTYSAVYKASFETTLTEEAKASSELESTEETFNSSTIIEGFETSDSLEIQSSTLITLDGTQSLVATETVSSNESSQELKTECQSIVTVTEYSYVCKTN